MAKLYLVSEDAIHAEIDGRRNPTCEIADDAELVAAGAAAKTHAEAGGAVALCRVCFPDGDIYAPVVNAEAESVDIREEGSIVNQPDEPTNELGNNTEATIPSEASVETKSNADDGKASTAKAARRAADPLPPAPPAELANAATTPATEPSELPPSIPTAPVAEPAAVAAVKSAQEQMNAAVAAQARADADQAGEQAKIKEARAGQAAAAAKPAGSPVVAEPSAVSAPTTEDPGTEEATADK